MVTLTSNVVHHTELTLNCCVDAALQQQQRLQHLSSHFTMKRKNIEALEDCAAELHMEVFIVKVLSISAVCLPTVRHKLHQEYHHSQFRYFTQWANKSHPHTCTRTSFFYFHSRQFE